MTLFARLLILAAALPLALAHGGSGGDSPSSSCKGTEFYWGDKEVCLPYGGTKNPPSAPQGSACPSDWEWHSGKSCCVPHEPPKPTTPSCNSGWGWNNSKKCCEPQHSTTPSKPTSTPSKPTSTPSKPTSTPSKPTSTPSKPTSTPPDNCKSGEWYWGDKNCCLPHGGHPNPPKPPKDTDCPPNWEWNNDKNCCVPHHPDQPPPQCGSGWGWDNGSKCCHPHQPTPPAPTPSSKPGKGGHNHWKRHAKARNVSLCPNGMEACPITGLKGLTDDWECLDTTSELESCGGCASTGAGQDCTAIPGAWNVGCNNGKCVVLTCAAGYLRSLDNTSCVKV